MGALINYLNIVLCKFNTGRTSNDALSVTSEEGDYRTYSHVILPHKKSIMFIQPTPARTAAKNINYVHSTYSSAANHNNNIICDDITNHNNT